MMVFRGLDGRTSSAVMIRILRVVVRFVVRRGVYIIQLVQVFVRLPVARDGILKKLKL